MQLRRRLAERHTVVRSCPSTRKKKRRFTSRRSLSQVMKRFFQTVPYLVFTFADKENGERRVFKKRDDDCFLKTRSSRLTKYQDEKTSYKTLSILSAGMIREPIFQDGRSLCPPLFFHFFFLFRRCPHRRRVLFRFLFIAPAMGRNRVSSRSNITYCDNERIIFTVPQCCFACVLLSRQCGPLNEGSMAFSGA